MTDRYPPPAYAATIWITPSAVMVSFPEASTVPIPVERLVPQTNEFGAVVPENRGLAVLLDMLKARMRDEARTIGKHSAPVRWDVEQALASDEKYQSWLAAMGVAKAENAAKVAEAGALLADLGL